MENPGLITFRQELLLTKPAELTQSRQQALRGHRDARDGAPVVRRLRHARVVGRHLAQRIVRDAGWRRRSSPSGSRTWDLDVERGRRQVGRDAIEDSLDSARAIRQPIKSATTSRTSFDGITYGKGEAVLTMIERTIGADTFQRGVRAYLAKHAWGNATYEDFVGAMTEVAGTDLHPLFDSFVKQSGVPLVVVRARRASKGAPPTLALAQQRYKPTGSTDRSQAHLDDPGVRDVGRRQDDRPRLHDALRRRPASSRLSAKTCPDWVLPNEGELGYYRSLPKGDLRDHAARARARPDAGRARRPDRRRQRAGRAAATSRERRRAGAGRRSREGQEPSPRRCVDRHRRRRRRHGLRQAAPELRAVHPQALPGACTRARLVGEAGRGRRRQGAAPRAARPRRRRRQGPDADRGGDRRSPGSGSTITRRSTPSSSAPCSTSPRATATRSCSIASTPRRRRRPSAPTALACCVRSARSAIPSSSSKRSRSR